MKDWHCNSIQELCMKHPLKIKGHMQSHLYDLVYPDALVHVQRSLVYPRYEISRLCPIIWKLGWLQLPTSSIHWAPETLKLLRLAYLSHYSVSTSWNEDIYECLRNEWFKRKYGSFLFLKEIIPGTKYITINKPQYDSGMNTEF